jgi:hypothetical protein
MAFCFWFLVPIKSVVLNSLLITKSMESAFTADSELN